MNSTEKPQKKSVAQYAPLLLLGTALLSVLLIFGVSFARYIKTQDQTVLLKSQSGTGVYLLQGSGGFSAPGDWVREEEGDGYLLSFRLSNAAAQQSYPAGDVRAQLFVPSIRRGRRKSSGRAISAGATATGRSTGFTTGRQSR